MRRAASTALRVSPALLLAACGYIGGPLPPLANVPAPVRDLAAIQRGDKIVAQFTIPTLTTEHLDIKPPLTLDLRIGPSVNPFTPERWAERSTKVPSLAKPKGAAYYEIPAAEWTGKEVAIGVRIVAGNGKESDWSNFVVLQPAPPPDQPKDLRAESTPAGIRLTWRARGDRFHVVRKNPADPNAPPVTADVEQPEFVDTTAAVGTEYSYTVVTFVPLGDNKEAQSDLSAEYKAARQAPLPATPSGLLAVPTPNSIELSWDSNTGAETVGYRIYRAAAAGEFAKIGEVSAVPTYSDPTAEHGKVYRYAVAAIDKDGRESPRSAAIEVQLP